MPTRPFRVSIGGLLVGIALIGVSLSALVSPSQFWANAYYMLTAATLILAVLRAIYSSGTARAFAVGFAVCGWSFFMAHFGPAPLSAVGPAHFLGLFVADVLYPFTIPAPPAPPAPAAPASLPGRIKGAVLPPARDGQVIQAGAFGGGGDDVVPIPPPTAWRKWTKPNRYMQFGRDSPEYFREIVLSLLCLAVAYLGGVATRHFCRTRRDLPPSTA